ncbi:tRNA adenosine(34) deaminase TadA [Thermodesulfobacteriota bacterium]
MDITSLENDVTHMRKALKYAKKAYKIGEVPIGAVLVKDDKIISYGYNVKEKKMNAIKHAEIIAIERASKLLGNWRLLDTTLYVNVEPCIMCAGAIVHARIKRVVYGCKDVKFGGVESLYNILTDERLNHNCAATGGVLEEESVDLMQRFFKTLRA